LYEALQNSKDIIENSISYLITNKAENIFSVDDVHLAGNNKDKKENRINLINEKDEKKILLYNSNLNERHEIVSFQINTPHIEIIDSNGLFVENVQISLLWPNMEGVKEFDSTSEKIDFSNDLNFSTDFDSNYFELLFHVKLTPLSLTTYTIRRKLKSELFLNSFNNVTFYYENLKQESVEKAKAKINDK
jgi:hypothetical protein